MKKLRLCLTLGAMIFTSGCYTTTLSNGKPVGQVAAEADDTWHSGVLTGGVDVSGDYELKKLCPDGWAEIRTETSVANEVVELLTWRVYAPQTVRVKCAAKAPEKSAAASEPQRPVSRL
jgi:hypothetical protein